MVTAGCVDGSAFTTGMARANGLGHSDLRRLIRSGRITRLTHGLYIWSGSPLDIQARADAFGLVLLQHQVICDRTAAWIHGIDTYELPGQPALLKLEAVALRGRTRTRREGCAGSVRDLAPDDIMTIGGVMVTTPVRTALDLACKLKPMSALAVVESYLHAGLVTKEELLSTLSRYKGRRGIRLAREIVELADPKVESTGESFTRMVIYRAGLPMPESQVWVLRDNESDIRLDHAYEGLKIAVEYDGEEFHRADRKEADEARREWLRRHGWYVIVVRKHQLSGAAAQAWISELRCEMAVRTRKAERYSRFARSW